MSEWNWFEASMRFIDHYILHLLSSDITLDVKSDTIVSPIVTVIASRHMNLEPVVVFSIKDEMVDPLVSWLCQRNAPLIGIISDSHKLSLDFLVLVIVFASDLSGQVLAQREEQVVPVVSYVLELEKRCPILLMFYLPS
jgi:hypothetical protein